MTLILFTMNYFDPKENSKYNNKGNYNHDLNPEWLDSKALKE